MEQDRNELLAKVGQLTIEVDWLKKNLQICLDPSTRRSLLSANSNLTLTRQSPLLDVNRTSAYYVPLEKDLEHENLVKERLDYWHTQMPYLGVRKLKVELKEDGIESSP